MIRPYIRVLPAALGNRLDEAVLVAEQLGHELAERAGHARPSMSLDVYSHVMPPDEVASERFLALIGGRGLM